MLKVDFESKRPPKHPAILHNWLVVNWMYPKSQSPFEQRGGENWSIFNPAKVLTAKHEGESSYRSRSVTQFYVRAASLARSLSAASAISNLGTRAKERKGVQEEETGTTSRSLGSVCKLGKSRNLMSVIANEQNPWVFILFSYRESDPPRSEFGRPTPI